MRATNLTMCLPLLLPLALSTLACSDSGDDGAEDDPLGDLIDDSKTDSLRKPTLHGRLYFGAHFGEWLSSDAKYHAWTFEVPDAAYSEEALITARTDYGADRVVDTVLYLYAYDQWTGKWSMIEKNDNDEGTSFSRLDRALEPGTYRLVVKGKKSTTTGPFEIRVSCAGGGCPGDRECLFSEKMLDMNNPPDALFAPEWSSDLLVADADQTITQRQIMAVVRSLYGYDFLHTIEAVFAEVEHNTVRLTKMHDKLGNRDFYVVSFNLEPLDPETAGEGPELQAGMFAPDSTHMVARIVDELFVTSQCEAFVKNAH